MLTSPLVFWGVVCHVPSATKSRAFKEVVGGSYIAVDSRHSDDVFLQSLVG